MIWYTIFVSLLFLLSVSLEASYGDDDECQYNSDCTNGTTACCHRRPQASVCRKTCYGESCYLSWDCGTDESMFCCEDHICRGSSNMCPADNETPAWITAIVVIAILCAAFGIGGTIICIYLKNCRRPNDLLVKENVAESTYGTS